MTCGKVIKRPPSLGQHCKIGSASSEASLVLTTCWTGACANLLRPHARRKQGPQQICAAPQGLAQPLRQPQVDQLAQMLVQFIQILHPQGRGHPLRRAKGIDQHRDLRAGDVLEQQRFILLGRPFRNPVGDLGDFQQGRDGRLDPDQLPAGFEQRDPLAQIIQSHIDFSTIRWG